MHSFINFDYNPVHIAYLSGRQGDKNRRIFLDNTNRNGSFALKQNIE